MKKYVFIIALFLTTNLFSQTEQKLDTMSLRISNIENTLNEYGHQQQILNKITIVSISTITICSLLNVPAAPLLMINTAADLITILISNKSNKKLKKIK